jgi:hypothetical protein
MALRLSRTSAGLCVLVLLAASATGRAGEGEARGKLPDNRTLDTFEYTYTPKVFGGPVAHFSVTREGKLRYSYSSEPHTNMGGQVVQKEWEVPRKEATALLQGLVDDGLLDLEDTRGGKFPNHYFKVSYGRWQLTAHPKELPESMMKRLRPYLEKAHPEFWKKEP